MRILTTDGRYLGGWYGNDSFVTSYPDVHEVFLEVAHHMGADGSFGEEVANSRGLYVRCDDVRLVEVLGPPGASPVDPTIRTTHDEATKQKEGDA